MDPQGSFPSVKLNHEADYEPYFGMPHVSLVVHVNLSCLHGSDSLSRWTAETFGALATPTKGPNPARPRSDSQQGPRSLDVETLQPVAVVFAAQVYRLHASIQGKSAANVCDQ